MSLNDTNSLSNTMWNCKYNIAFDKSIRGKYFLGRNEKKGKYCGNFVNGKE